MFRISAGRRHSSVPAHLLRVPGESEQKWPVQMQRKKEVTARSDAAEWRCSASGGQVRVDLIHDLQVRVAVEARGKWHRAEEPELPSPFCLLCRSAARAGPASRRAYGLKHL